MEPDRRHGETRGAGRAASEATVEEILTVFDDVPSLELARTQLESGIGMAELVVSTGLATSKGEATRLIKQGGLYVNDQRMLEERGQAAAGDRP